MNKVKLTPLQPKFALRPLPLHILDPPLLVYQYMAIFFSFSPTSNHLHPLHVENCDSNSRLVVDEDDNGELRLEKVKALKFFHITLETKGSL